MSYLCISFNFFFQFKNDIFCLSMASIFYNIVWHKKLTLKKTYVTWSKDITLYDHEKMCFTLYCAICVILTPFPMCKQFIKGIASELALKQLWWSSRSCSKGRIVRHSLNKCSIWNFEQVIYGHISGQNYFVLPIKWFGTEYFLLLFGDKIKVADFLVLLAS